MGGTWSLPGRTARLPAQAAKLAANRVAGVGVDPLRGAARGPPVPVRAGGLRRRPAVQVGHAAGGAAHLALVETGIA